MAVADIFAARPNAVAASPSGLQRISPEGLATLRSTFGIDVSTAAPSTGAPSTDLAAIPSSGLQRLNATFGLNLGNGAPSPSTASNAATGSSAPLIPNPGALVTATQKLVTGIPTIRNLFSQPSGPNAPILPGGPDSGLPVATAPTDALALEGVPNPSAATDTAAATPGGSGFGAPLALGAGVAGAVASALGAPRSVSETLGLGGQLAALSAMNPAAFGSTIPGTVAPFAFPLGVVAASLMAGDEPLKSNYVMSRTFDINSLKNAAGALRYLTPFAKTQGDISAIRQLLAASSGNLINPDTGLIEHSYLAMDNATFQKALDRLAASLPPGPATITGTPIYQNWQQARTLAQSPAVQAWNQNQQGADQPMPLTIPLNYITGPQGPSQPWTNAIANMASLAAGRQPTIGVDVPGITTPVALAAALARYRAMPRPSTTPVGFPVDLIEPGQSVPAGYVPPPMEPA